MIELKNVSKRYKRKMVLSNINYTFLDKGCYALLGANGSGKSVLLSIICGYIIPTKGNVLINKHELNSRNKYIKNAGIIINSPDFISNLTIRENLVEVAKILNISSTIGKMDKLIELFGLSNLQETRYKDCSMGMKQKMRLIQAFMEEKDIYILDEPMNALDKKSVEIVKSIIKDLKKDKLVIITSHIESSLQDLYDYEIEMADGMII